MDSCFHGNDEIDRQTHPPESATLKFKTMSTLLITLLLCGLLAWLGLPAMLRALGLHPHYSGPVYALPGKRALIITTSQATLGAGGKATGVFGSELTAPYYAFLDGDKQVKELGITQTPQHPERELRAAGALFESRQALLDPFANLTVTDGRLVTGQNQNAGVETAQTMLRVAGGLPRP